MLRVVKTDYAAEIREQLTGYIAQTDENQSYIAKKVGVSKTAISLFLKGTYTGNNDEPAQKVEQYIQMSEARKNIIKEPEICLSVGNTKDILEKSRIAHMNDDILLIHGPAGCGKTTALKYYAEHNNGVIFVEADVTINSPPAP